MNYRFISVGVILLKQTKYRVINNDTGVFSNNNRVTASFCVTVIKHCVSRSVKDNSSTHWTSKFHVIKRVINSAIPACHVDFSSIICSLDKAIIEHVIVEKLFRI